MKKLILSLVAKSNLSDYKKAAIADILTAKDFALFTFDELNGMTVTCDCDMTQTSMISYRTARDYDRAITDVLSQDAAVEEALRLINK